MYKVNDCMVYACVYVCVIYEMSIARQASECDVSTNLI